MPCRYLSTQPVPLYGICRWPAWTALMNIYSHRFQLKKLMHLEEKVAAWHASYSRPAEDLNQLH